MLSSLDHPQAESADDSESFQQACATALRLLVRREHSAQELRYKLTGRGYTPALAERVVTVLRGEQALSDRRFAGVYARGRYERGFGPLRIEAGLRERGVSPALIDAALADPDFDWVLSACRQRHKRFGADVPNDFGERARQMRFLQQRGFNSDQIRAALADETETRI